MALSDFAPDIIGRFSAGEPVPKIAKDYEVSRAAIYLFIERHHPQAKFARAAAREALYTAIRAAHAAGSTIVAIARQFGLSRPRIHEIVHATS